MQVIIPMAGLGQRFQFAGYKDPKPLIDIDGKPVIEHIVNMFPDVEKLIFIANENHLANTNMRDVLQRVAPHGKVVAIPEHRLGPVYTVLQAVEHIDDNLPVVTCYCDIHTPWNFKEFVQHMQDTNAEAGVVAFKGFHPPLLQEGLYATARTDENDDEVLEVREKFSFTPNKMDSWTSAGVHYFKSGALVKKYFKKLIDLDIRCNDEFYISMIHNLLIEDKLKNVLHPIDFFISWGKPEDVREYQYWSKHFNK
ncbi:MAG TPA: NTP transferase domain-containing protein [Candidatus Paceibacterota bacterium]|nr:NTP transferase domain-containing protein [Candidatus Paceibacterota bacterium]